MTNSQKFNAEMIRATRQQMLDQMARELNEIYCEERLRMRNKHEAEEAAIQADMVADGFEIFKTAAMRLGMSTQVELDYENWGEANA